MARERFSTTLESTLLALAREKAEAKGFAGVNAVIERALQFYFANCAVEVWKRGFLETTKILGIFTHQEFLLFRFNFGNFTPNRLLSYVRISKLNEVVE